MLCNELGSNELSGIIILIIEQVLEAATHKDAAVRPPTTHQENYPSYTNQTCRTLLEKSGRTHKKHTPMEPDTWTSIGRTTS